MSIEHRNLTGDQLHEPKGIESAAANTVYVANGSGSGSWQPQSGGGGASVNDSITDGNTATAPSENAVYDALQLKAGVDLTNVSDADFATKAASAGVGGGGAGVADAIADGVTTVAPSQNAVYDALQLKAATNLANVSDADFLSKAGAAAVVEDTIANGVTTKAPSQNAVFDALALKTDTGHTHAQSDITGLSTALSGKASTNLSNVSDADFASKASSAGVGGGGGSISVAIIQDQKTSGTNGQSLSNGLWTTRVLNTEVADPDSIVSLSSNQFSLDAGTYLIEGIGSWSSSTGAAKALSRIYNVTDSTVTGYGTTTSIGGASSGHIQYVDTSVSVLVIIAGTKAFTFDTYLGNQSGSTGFAQGLSGVNEVYSTVVITKLA